MKQLGILFFITFCLCGCASKHFNDTEAGKLSGKLKVQWLKPDQFLFIPDKDDPLTFHRSSGESISPGAMYTDGGSIPRPLWAFRNYSPWGYAPAFIVHDWLFEMKHCGLPGSANYDVFIAGQVMSEIIKTLMQQHPDIEENKFVMYSMYEAVTSKIAQKLWLEGGCKQPIMKAFTGDGKAPLVPLMEYTIEFPK
ncbi:MULTISPECIES: DUF1353 domain-containing protein [Pseudoalteromonas]|uniref:DUF1353 domain-containing protein n=1 Tax=Pseudoalteromonas TaxID=53246 RepID=UPI00083CDB23|nr:MULTISPECIES: DUF1353 domain-containing protein [Pseudoalteromonas]ODB36221.1 hypothetical protein BB427_15930 [Pseudoalteromonas sp. BMB]WMO15393.1 DUF1353 domain-containing protein [Pseudoalteromonas piscicida]